MSIGNQIIERIRQGGFSPLELEYNPALKSLIEQILNEQKISWEQDFSNGDPEWEEWESTLYHEAETGLLPRDIEDVIKQLLGETSEFKMSEMHFSRVNKERAIPGMSPTIKRFLGDDGIIHFYPQFSEFDYIYNQILDPNFSSYQSMIDKVLVPYIDFLETTDIDNGQNLPFEVPENIREGMAEVFEEVGEQNSTDGLNKDGMIDYTLYNVLQLANSVEMRGVLNKVRNARVRNGGAMTPEQERDVVEEIFAMVISKHDKPMPKLECILNGISGQLYMNTLEQKDMGHTGITDKVKNAFKLYTMHERGDQTFETDEHGYRTVDVGLGKRDVLLRRFGDNISRAMDNLGVEVSTIMENADKIPEEEYLKHVARLHFRYITIHPFRDSNGRIGRNLINMMLGQIGRNFVMPKDVKSNYLAAMENMRQGVYGEMGQFDYLLALSDYPQKLLPIESKYCEGLAQIIEKSNTLPIKRKRQRDDKSVEEPRVQNAEVEF